MDVVFWIGAAAGLATFAISLGLAIRQRSEKDKYWKWNAIISAIGLVGTGVSIQQGIASAVDAARIADELAAAKSGIKSEVSKREELLQSSLWRNGLIDLFGWERNQAEKNLKLAIQAKGKDKFDESDLPKVTPIKVHILCIREREPMWVAHNVAYSIRRTQYLSVASIRVVDGRLRNGIEIIESDGSDPNGFRRAAKDAIIEGFKNNFSTAWEAPFVDSGIAPDELAILIGRSDRFSGPVDFRSEEDIKNGMPLTDLPPPLSFQNENGKEEVFHFDPAHDSDMKEPSANGTFIKIP